MMRPPGAVAILLGVLLQNCAAAPAEWDPCLPKNHTTMLKQETRSPNYRTKTAVCDRRLPEAWYRVMSEGDADMTTSCPAEVRCNTVYPVWLTGTIPPPDGRIHNRTAAMRYDTECSYLKWPIQVKNCGSFRVYFLKSVSACPAAYCFDKITDQKVSTKTTTKESTVMTTSRKPVAKSPITTETTTPLVTEESDPCLPKNHILMGAQERRSTSYKTETATCDRRLNESWYRVVSEAGEDMATKCPPQDRCNTVYPVWINGAIPEQDGEVHKRMAAMRHGGDCFFFVWPIYVKNCGNFRVYFLTSVPACPAAYCFGNTIDQKVSTKTTTKESAAMTTPRKPVPKSPIITETTTAHVTEEKDPCLPKNHILMGAQERRSTSYKTETATCDRRLKESWYRVVSEAGEDMATKCPPQDRCNTVYPVWINGTIPERDGQVHKRMAALRYESDCSSYHWSIYVKNCGNFRVYFLTSVPACPAAYCFGDGLKRVKTTSYPTTEKDKGEKTIPRTRIGGHSSTTTEQPTIGLEVDVDRDKTEISHFWYLVVAALFLVVIAIVISVTAIIIVRNRRGTGSDKPSALEPKQKELDKVGSNEYVSGDDCRAKLKDKVGGFSDIAIIGKAKPKDKVDGFCDIAIIGEKGGYTNPMKVTDDEPPDYDDVIQGETHVYEELKIRNSTASRVYDKIASETPDVYNEIADCAPGIHLYEKITEPPGEEKKIAERTSKTAPRISVDSHAYEQVDGQYEFVKTP